VQEYVQHLGAVNTVNFIDDNRRVVTTADDKKLFVWEYGIGTAPMKHVAGIVLQSVARALQCVACVLQRAGVSCSVLRRRL